jgi:hypothetical protein
MNNLAVVLHRQGKYAEAEAMHREALELRENVLGFSDPKGLEITEQRFAYGTKFTEPLYQALLCLSFREHLSWHVVKNNNGGSLCVLYTQDRSKEAIITSQGQLDNFLDIVDKARSSLSDINYWSWDRKEQKAEERKPQSIQRDWCELRV